MTIEYYRPRIHGPEEELEDMVLNRINQIPFIGRDEPVIGLSPSIGIGYPDILIIPQFNAPNYWQHVLKKHTQIISIIRTLGPLNWDSLIEFSHLNSKIIDKSLKELMGLGVLKFQNDEYFLSETWRHFEPIVITIEVKVSNWQKVLVQAKRNLLFSHFSYIALPEENVNRLLNSNLLQDSPLGLICINSTGITIKKEAFETKPQIWNVFYKALTFGSVGGKVYGSI